MERQNFERGRGERCHNDAQLYGHGGGVGERNLTNGGLCGGHARQLDVRPDRDAAGLQLSPLAAYLPHPGTDGGGGGCQRATPTCAAHCEGHGVDDGGVRGAAQRVLVVVEQQNKITLEVTHSFPAERVKVRRNGRHIKAHSDHRPVRSPGAQRRWRGGRRRRWWRRGWRGQRRRRGWRRRRRRRWRRRRRRRGWWRGRRRRRRRGQRRLVGRVGRRRRRRRRGRRRRRRRRGRRH